MDKIFIAEVVAEMHTIQDILRWAITRFTAAGIFFRHGPDIVRDQPV
ncbi:MAG TPA: 50S ribosomal protein L3 N(5)-glutamine methyltransferase, partial [Aeromonas salmonicida]|nr:50S ribosomal protein L3 N(5)-glutamine methyltransferase [Aeromonas salmonicida]